MGQSKEEVAKALEAMASGQADAQAGQSHRQPSPPPDDIPTPPAVRVSHSVRPLPGKPGVPAEQRPVATAVTRRIFLRQTLIPPLLTLGVLMPIAGVASLLMHDESPLDEHPFVSALLILLGLLMMGAAVFNMLHVRHLLSASGKR